MAVVVIPAVLLLLRARPDGSLAWLGGVLLTIVSSCSPGSRRCRPAISPGSRVSASSCCWLPASPCSFAGHHSRRRDAEGPMSPVTSRGVDDFISATEAFQATEPVLTNVIG